MLEFCLFYLLVWAVFLACGLLKNWKDGDDARLQVFLAAIIWPAALLALLDLFIRSGGRFPDKEGKDGSLPRHYAPQSWNAYAKTRANYNDMVFGKKGQAGEKSEEEEMAAFIASFDKEKDAPLVSEVTFTFGPTGTAKTYPAGTVFPRALIEDCKNGYFFRPSRPVPPQAGDE